MSTYHLGSRVTTRIVPDGRPDWPAIGRRNLSGLSGAVVEIKDHLDGTRGLLVKFDREVRPWFLTRNVTGLWFTADELVPEVRAVLRAPRQGERGWWVANVATPIAALREFLRTCPELVIGEFGWEAERDYDWQADKENMHPVTLEVLA